jgi:hypothetical protein
MNMRARFIAALAASGLAGGLLVAAVPSAAIAASGVITTRAGGPGRGPAREVAQLALSVVAVHSGTFYGQAMTAGDIYTIAGTGLAP